MNCYTATQPLRLESEGNIHDGHWSQRHRRRRAHRSIGQWMVKWHDWMGEPAKLVVTLERSAPSSGLDDDNLRTAFKGIRDGVADKLMLKGDRDPRVTWCYRQRRGDYAIFVTIEEAAP